MSGRLGVTALLLLATACGGADPAPDAAVADGGSTVIDAGPTPSDGGGTPSDAGETPPDAGEAPSDAGEAPSDSGPTPPDAGQAPPDAGGTPSDAGPAGPPRGLTRWIDGDPADHVPAAAPGPALILMGGGTEVDAAFTRAAQRAPQGDVLVLRASGADGYQDYLFTEIGGFSSVETLLVDRRALADDPWVAERARTAEVIFFAGGDQGRYVDLWSGTALITAVQAAWDGGAIVGGTSAGEMLLGTTVFAARTGGLTSAELLAAPAAADLAPGPLTLAPLAGLVLDSHFSERDRFGRLVVFAARVSAAAGGGAAHGLGIDERTALWVEADGSAEVMGRGAVYALEVEGPRTIPAGSPLAEARVRYRTLRAGDTIALPSLASAIGVQTATVTDGVLSR